MGYKNKTNESQVFTRGNRRNLITFVDDIEREQVLAMESEIVMDLYSETLDGHSLKRR